MAGVEAFEGGDLLGAGLLPDVLHTSLQTRAIHTAELTLAGCGRSWIPVRRSWRLNERHYGALQGKDKAQTLEEFGAEQFQLWRRSFDVPPPPLEDSSEWSQANDERYAGLGADLPRTESLKLVIDRMLPYWQSDIAPDLKAGRLVVPFDFKMSTDFAYYLVYPPESIRRRKIKAFRDWLMTLAESATTAATTATAAKAA